MCCSSRIPEISLTWVSSTLFSGASDVGDGVSTTVCKEVVSVDATGVSLDNESADGSDVLL